MLKAGEPWARDKVANVGVLTMVWDHGTRTGGNHGNLHTGDYYHVLYEVQ